MIDRITDSIRGALGLRKKEFTMQGSLGDVISQAWASGSWLPSGVGRFFGDRISQPYKRSPSIFAPVHFFAGTVSSIPLVVYEGSRGDPDAKKPVGSNNKWQKLFDSPHPQYTTAELLKYWVLHLFLAGRAMWLCKDGDGEPCEPAESASFWPLFPSRTALVFDSSSELLMGVEVRDGAGKVTKYDADFILHWYEPDPDDPKESIARIDSVLTGAATELDAKKANRTLLKKGMGFSGVFSSPDWRVTARRVEVEKETRDRASGPQNFGDALFLPGDVKWSQSHLSLKEMQFKELLDHHAGESRTTIGVPAGLLSPDANIPFASLFAMLQYFAQFRVKPVLVQWQDTMWSRLFAKVSGGKYWVEFDTSGIAIFQEDTKAKAEAAGAVKSLNISTADAAVIAGLRIPKRPYHETPLVNSSLVPIQMAVAGETLYRPTNEPTPPEDAPPKADDDPEDNRVEPSDADKSAPAKPRSSGADGYVQDVLGPHEKRIIKKLKNYFNDQRRDVLARYDDIIGVRNSLRGVTAKALSVVEIEKVLFELAEWNKEVVARMTPNWRQIIMDAVEDLADEVGGLENWGTASERVIAKIIQNAAVRVRNVNNSTRADLYRILVEAGANNLTVQETRQAISSFFNERGATWSLPIARTETAGAASSGRHEAGKADGLDKKRWRTAGDEAVSDGSHGNRNHAALEGEERDIDELFSNNLPYSSAIDGEAREVVNCRCKTEYFRA